MKITGMKIKFCELHRNKTTRMRKEFGNANFGKTFHVNRGIMKGLSTPSRLIIDNRKRINTNLGIHIEGEQMKLTKK